jgi:signal transduction histidine kinase
MIVRKKIFPISYTSAEWRVAATLAVGYLGTYILTAYFLPESTLLYPASAALLAGLFFGGVRLWPVVLVVSIFAGVSAGISIPLALCLALIETAQAVMGAYLLRKARVDPLFRRYRDMFYLVSVTALVALVGSSLRTGLNVLGGVPYSAEFWGHAFVASFFCLLVITPFILRWFAKPRFGRPLLEVLEILIVFGLLVTIDYSLFIRGILTAMGIPLVYFMLIPLFWIALRLRPRFTTLALLITSVFAAWAILSAHLNTEEMGTQLFQTEAFIITITIIFYFITSLEEDRRLNTNLMRSQLSSLENAVARISSESRAKNDFIAILAHELRNPLAPIVSAIDLLKLDENRSADEMQTLEMMDERMMTVRRLLDDLLDVSRISEGKLSITKEPVDLQEIIKRSVLSTAHHIKERHQALLIQNPKGSLIVTGDAVRLEQIFSNLLINASKYSDPGDQITVSVKKKPNEAQITVSDQGIGISSHELKNIFTPFHQIGNGARTQKGLGIGLALVQSFVEVHGGTITAVSKGSGQGSQFTVTFPLLESAQPSIATFQKQKMPSLTVGHRILIVDKNDAAAWNIGHPLEMSGYIVTYAYGGNQALEIFTEESFDIVVLDMSLPDLDAHAVARALRARGFTGRLVALTDYSTAQMTPEGKEAGFTHFLVKPVGLSDLKRLLKETP